MPKKLKLKHNDTEYIGIEHTLKHKGIDISGLVIRSVLNHFHEILTNKGKVIRIYWEENSFETNNNAFFSTTTWGEKEFNKV